MYEELCEERRCERRKKRSVTIAGLCCLAEANHDSGHFMEGHSIFGASGRQLCWLAEANHDSGHHFMEGHSIFGASGRQLCCLAEANLQTESRTMPRWRHSAPRLTGRPRSPSTRTLVAAMKMLWTWTDSVGSGATGMRRASRGGDRSAVGANCKPVVVLVLVAAEVSTSPRRAIMPQEFH